jgi:hypothetical protein
MITARGRDTGRNASAARLSPEGRGEVPSDRLTAPRSLPPGRRARRSRRGARATPSPRPRPPGKPRREPHSRPTRTSTSATWPWCSQRCPDGPTSSSPARPATASRRWRWAVSAPTRASPSTSSPSRAGRSCSPRCASSPCSCRPSGRREPAGPALDLLGGIPRVPVSPCRYCTGRQHPRGHEGVTLRGSEVSHRRETAAARPPSLDSRG